MKPPDHAKAHIAAAAALGAAAAKEAAKDVFAENIAEVGENVLHVHMTAAVAAAPAAHAGMPEAVVLRALVGIAEHFIGFGRFLELFFRLFIAGVAVGVELHGYLAVRLFDLILRGGF